MTDTFYSYFESLNYASEEHISELRAFYLPYVKPLLEHLDAPLAVDFGCGRGEWLALLRELGFRTQGIDADQGMLSPAREKGLDVHLGDGNAYLRTIPDQSVAVLTAFHVLEHLPFDKIMDFFAQSKRILMPGGLLIAETPNSESLHVSSSNFYLDPTHIRPIPILQMMGLVRYFGYTEHSLVRLQEDKKLYSQNPVTFRDLYYGISKDYAVIAQQPGGTEALKLAVSHPLRYQTGIGIDELLKRLDAQTARLVERVDALTPTKTWQSGLFVPPEDQPAAGLPDTPGAPLQIPKILHRVYFENYHPFKDPFLHYLATWHQELPHYKVMRWGQNNVDVNINEWMRRSAAAQDPVFLSEYVRWAALKEFGGVYLDSDCEVLNGPVFDKLIDELNASDSYDAFMGVEEFEDGYPTAQTVAAKQGAEIVDFMFDLYSNHLSSALWHWRAERLLIGPQLMSLYFRDKGLKIAKGCFSRLKEPIIVGRVKIYPQEYFSPKFTITGTKLNVTENTCIYHLFANLNVKDLDPDAEKHRREPMLFNAYCEHLEALAKQRKGPLPTHTGYRRQDGSFDVKKILNHSIKNPAYAFKKIWNYAKK